MTDTNGKEAPPRKWTPAEQALITRCLAAWIYALQVEERGLAAIRRKQRTPDEEQQLWRVRQWRSCACWALPGGRTRRSLETLELKPLPHGVRPSHAKVLIPYLHSKLAQCHKALRYYQRAWAQAQDRAHQTAVRVWSEWITAIQHALQTMEDQGRGPPRHSW